MAHLWVWHGGEWAIVPMGARPVFFGSWMDRDAVPDEVACPADGPRLVGIPSGDSTTWVLLTPSAGVFVNGSPVLGGIRVLADRDEVRAAGAAPVYFSTETLAGVESLQAGDHETVCARCRQEIEPGTGAVRCPGCGVWHHASDAFECWTYAPTCALCPQSTSDMAGFRWTPEGL